MKSKVCLVVLSHSSYSDIWELTLASYEKFFSYPIDLYLTTDFEPAEDDMVILNRYNFNHLVYPVNLAWSCALRFVYNNYLEGRYDYVMFSFDDLVLLNYVDNLVLDTYFELMSKNDLNYLIMNNSHESIYSKMGLFKGDSLSFEIPEMDTYRGSLVFSCWKDSFFQKVINKTELTNLSPWAYEQIISQSLKGEERLFATRKVIFKYSNVLVKGKIYLPELRKATKDLSFNYTGRRDILIGKRLSKFIFYVFMFNVLRFLLPPKFFYYLRILNNMLR